MQQNFTKNFLCLVYFSWWKHWRNSFNTQEVSTLFFTFILASLFASNNFVTSNYPVEDTSYNKNICCNKWTEVIPKPFYCWLRPHGAVKILPLWEVLQENLGEMKFSEDDKNDEYIYCSCAKFITLLNKSWQCYTHWKNIFIYRSVNVHH